MHELLPLASATAAGLLLGAFFFGGLWWTVVRGVSSPQPALWFFGGLLLRMSATLTGFYLVGGENWERWLACLLGFVLARLIVRWFSGALAKTGADSAREATYAP